jgi:hypothetical protein
MRMIRLAPPFSFRVGTSITCLQLMSILADQSCVELGTPDVHLPCDIFNCFATPTNLRGSRLEHQYTLTGKAVLEHVYARHAYM